MITYMKLQIIEIDFQKVLYNRISAIRPKQFLSRFMATIEVKVTC